MAQCMFCCYNKVPETGKFVENSLFGSWFWKLGSAEHGASNFLASGEALIAASSCGKRHYMPRESKYASVSFSSFSYKTTNDINEGITHMASSSPNYL